MVPVMTLAVIAVSSLVVSASATMSATAPTVRLMVWVVMTTVITMLLQQAIVFGRLGGTYARVTLLNTRKLLPFARVSIISSLAVIGALALFPLINLPPRQTEAGYVRPPITDQTFVPEIYVPEDKSEKVKD